MTGFLPLAGKELVSVYFSVKSKIENTTGFLRKAFENWRKPYLWCVEASTNHLHAEIMMLAEQDRGC